MISLLLVIFPDGAVAHRRHYANAEGSREAEEFEKAVREAVSREEHGRITSGVVEVACVSSRGPARTIRSSSTYDAWSATQ